LAHSFLYSPPLFFGLISPSLLRPFHFPGLLTSTSKTFQTIGRPSPVVVPPHVPLKPLAPLDLSEDPCLKCTMFRASCPLITLIYVPLHDFPWCLETVPKFFLPPLMHFDCNPFFFLSRPCLVLSSSLIADRTPFMTMIPPPSNIFSYTSSLRAQRFWSLPCPPCSSNYPLPAAFLCGIFTSIHSPPPWFFFQPNTPNLFQPLTPVPSLKWDL